MRYKLIIILLIWICGPAGFSGVNARDTTTVFQEEVWEHITRKYDYTENLKTFEPRENNTEMDINSDSMVAFLKIFIIVIIAGIVIFLMYNISSTLIINKQNLKVKSKELQFHEIEENLPDIDLFKWLNEALLNGLYKQALRINYLLIIQKLALLDFIDWKKDKTNGDFMNEMRGRQFFNEFRLITLVYEKVWYGDVEMDENKYSKFSKSFNQFIDALET